MRKPLQFFVAGLPKAQPRVKGRSVTTATRTFTHIYTPGDADDWKTIIRYETKNAWVDYPNQWLGPLSVDLTFFFPRPKGHFNSKGLVKPNSPHWHTSAPDVDNLFKSFGDAITNVGLWGDDRQVSETRIRKIYSDDGRTGVQVEIREADGVAPVAPAAKLQPTLFAQ